uniref:Uncharacterized protein n=1 Tax=Dictyoglomus turgidum TaxID=513050 RepID=A0A7C3WLV0_9BACT
MNEIIILGIIAFAILLIFRSKAIFNILTVLLIFSLIFPFIVSLIRGSDPWVFTIFIIVICFIMLQGILSLIFGKDVANTAVGNLIANLLLAPFKILIEIFRALFFGFIRNF